MASRAIEYMEEHDMNKPERPVKKKEGQDWDSNDPEFKMEREECIEEMKESRLKGGYWEENQLQAYNLLFQHCPPELETHLAT